MALTEKMGNNDGSDDGGLEGYGSQENSQENHELNVCHHSHGGFEVGCKDSVDVGYISESKQLDVIAYLLSMFEASLQWDAVLVDHLVLLVGLEEGIGTSARF